MSVAVHLFMAIDTEELAEIKAALEQRQQWLAAGRPQAVDPAQVRSLLLGEVLEYLAEQHAALQEWKDQDTTPLPQEATPSSTNQGQQPRHEHVRDVYPQLIALIRSRSFGKLGGETAIVVPLAEYRRLRALELQATPGRGWSSRTGY
jgi:hypothetical protein